MLSPSFLYPVHSTLGLCPPYSHGTISGAYSGNVIGGGPVRGSPFGGAGACRGGLAIRASIARAAPTSGPDKYGQPVLHELYPAGAYPVLSIFKSVPYAD